MWICLPSDARPLVRQFYPVDTNVQALVVDVIGRTRKTKRSSNTLHAQNLAVDGSELATTTVGEFVTTAKIAVLVYRLVR